MTFLVTIEGMPALDEDLLAQLSQHTRKPAAEWRRALVAPQLARVVLSAERKHEAEQIAERLQAAGLLAHVADRAGGKEAIEDAFEATWAEPDGPDGLLFIGPTGEDMRVGSSSVRLIASGGQVKNGQRQLFVVLGLRDGPGAVILRVPGADVSKIVRHAEEPPDVVDAFVDFIAKRAPHALVERGLDAHAGRLPGLDELGTKDLAHAPVVAAWLLRAFPPQRRAPAPRSAVAQEAVSPFHADPNALDSFPPPSTSSRATSSRAAPAMAAPFGALELDDAAPAAPQGLADIAIPAGPPPKVTWRDTLLTPQQAARRKRLRLIAAAAAAVILVALGFSVLHKPASSEHLLHAQESWTSPYGVTFTYKDAFDAGFDGVHDFGFVVDVAKGGEVQTLRIAGHDAKTERDAFGIHFRVSSFDDTGARASWIVVDARK